VRPVLSAPAAVFRSLGRWLVGLAGAIVRYPADAARTIGRAWHRFFFTPADPTSLGAIRIVVGLLALWSFLTIGFDLQGALGQDAWADPDTIRLYLKDHDAAPTAWSLWFLVPDRFLLPAWAAGLLVLVFFTLGVSSRVTAVLAWVITLSTARRAPVLFFGFDGTLVTWLFYLAASGASGQAISFDRLLARRRHRAGPLPVPTVSANLGLRLIQLHLCLIYGASGLAKLQGPAWWSGNAVLMVLLLPEYRVGDFTWLAAYPRFLNLMTHATVALEILYPVLVWVRVFRPLMIVGMVMLHVGIDLTLGLREFSLTMIAANLAFVPGRVFRGRFDQRCGA
jgi:hypothetical protein